MSASFAIPWTVAHQALLSMEISQSRILQWVIISFSSIFSQPRDQTHVSGMVSRFFTTEPPGKPLFQTPVTYQIIFGKYFLPVCALPSLSVYTEFCRAEVFNVNEVSLSMIYFKKHIFVVTSKKSSKYSRPFGVSSKLSSKSFVALHFTFGSMTHFRSIFLKSVRSVFKFFLPQFVIIGGILSFPPNVMISSWRPDGIRTRLWRVVMGTSGSGQHFTHCPIAKGNPGHLELWL